MFLDVLIKVNKAAICGTDIHIYNWDAWASANVPTPMTIGHEYVGTIAEIGRDSISNVFSAWSYAVDHFYGFFKRSILKALCTCTCLCVFVFVFVFVCLCVFIR